MKDYNSPEYKRSRGAYISQQTAEYFVSILVTDAFLAKLLTWIGISDALAGIISSFITLAFVVQLASIFLVRLKVSAKKLTIFFDTLSIFSYMFLFFVPFITQDKTLRTVLVVLSVLIAYIGKYLINSIAFKWANSYVEPTKRARFSANKEMISLFTGMIFTTIVGIVIDRYESLGDLEGAFLFIGVGVLVLNIVNFISFSLIKKDSIEEQTDNSQPFKEVIKNTFGNKNFRSVIVLTVIMNIASYFTVGFIGVFKTNDLMMSMLLIQIINVVANFARMLISKPIAKYSDKFSYAKGMQLGLMISAAGYLAIVFTTKATWFLMIVYVVLHNCSLAGTNQNSFNIAYSYVDSKYITQAMAIKNSIGGICGFFASLAGGKILSVIQANGNTLFGIPVYGQQVLASISVVMLVVTIIYIRKVISKQEIMVQ